MLADLQLHQALIDRPGSRWQLNTPALVVDVDALDRNIARMAGFARSAGVVLRPHAKTHKSVHIARRQIEAGAAGICCAKLGEAEALAAGGIDSILITSPVVTAPAIRRFAALHSQVRDLRIVVDNPDNVAALAQAAVGRPFGVLIDIDPGIRRTGAISPQAALDLLAAIRRHGLQYMGVQMYCGMQQHIVSYAQRAAAIADRTNYLRSVIAALDAQEAPPQIVTGCGTGTHHIDARLGVFNEWQVGSYVFMDREYSECDLANRSETAFEYSLFVDSRVISANTRGMATIDAGLKAFATDAGEPVILSGGPQGSTYRFMGDEHGAIIDPAGAHAWNLGDVVTLAVPHCDPTVNLYDVYHVVSGDTLIGIWPVTARGRSR